MSSEASSPQQLGQVGSSNPKRNSREERNFRSHYYEKVGFKVRKEGEC